MSSLTVPMPLITAWEICSFLSLWNPAVFTRLLCFCSISMGDHIRYLQICFTCNIYNLGDKVSMLTHIHPHKDSVIRLYSHLQSPGWQPISCVAWCLIWRFARVEGSVVINDAECSHWKNGQYIHHDYLCLSIGNIRYADDIGQLHTG